MNVLVLVLADVLRLVDDVPEDENVKAGWTAFAVFILLIGSVAVLGLSLVKQLRRADAARKAGVYGDEPESDATADEQTEQPVEPENHSAS